MGASLSREQLRERLAALEAKECRLKEVRKESPEGVMEAWFNKLQRGDRMCRYAFLSYDKKNRRLSFMRDETIYCERIVRWSLDIDYRYETVYLHSLGMRHTFYRPQDTDVQRWISEHQRAAKELEFVRRKIKSTQQKIMSTYGNGECIGPNKTVYIVNGYRLVNGEHMTYEDIARELEEGEPGESEEFAAELMQILRKFETI